MKAVNIEWDVDMDEVYEMLDEMLVENAAKNLELPVKLYMNMTTSEKHNYAYDFFRHCPGALYDFLGLPEEEDIDVGILEEDVADYLSNKHGYCINRLEIVDTQDLGTFTVDVTLQENGKFDVYIAHEGSSGEHYTDVTADRIGEIVAGDIECIAEGYMNEFGGGR